MYKILTFNIPDTFNRSFVYTNNTQYIGIYTDGDLPNITGITGYTAGYPSGAFYTGVSQTAGSLFDTYYTGVAFDASRCSQIYNNDIDFVRPRCVIIQAAIKY